MPAVSPEPETLVAELMPVATATRAHHHFGPSKFNHLRECPGFESENTGECEAAEEGTRCHEVMEEAVKRYFAAEPRKPLLDVLLTVLTETALDQEEWDYLKRCADVIEPYLVQATDHRIEIGVSVPDHKGEEISRGYLDLALWFGPTVALLTDWKFGWLPVPAADQNQQGQGYAVGLFRMFPQLERVGVMFVQPKLQSVSRHIYRRQDVPRLIAGIQQTISSADSVQRDRAGHSAKLHVNDACAYCRHKNGCAAGLRETLAVARRVPDSGLPTGFPSLDAIQTPEQAAAIRYSVGKIEEFLEGIKGRAKEIAIANGGTISATLPSGEAIVYGVEYHNADRQLGTTAEVVDGLKDVVSLEELLAAAEFSIGKLEDVVAGNLYEQHNLPLEQKLIDFAKGLDAEVACGKLTKTAAKAKLTEAKKSWGKKITKDEARQRFNSLLEAQGLISRPDGKVAVLRRKKAAKQLTEQHTN
jgi:hypothetical protein